MTLNCPLLVSDWCVCMSVCVCVQYMSLMAELGEGPPPAKPAGLGHSSQHHQHHHHHHHHQQNQHSGGPPALTNRSHFNSGPPPMVSVSHHVSSQTFVTYINEKGSILLHVGSTLGYVSSESAAMCMCPCRQARLCVTYSVSKYLHVMQICFKVVLMM